MARSTGEIRFPKFHAAQAEIYSQLTRRTVLRCGRRLGKTTMLEVIGGDEAIREPNVFSKFDRIAGKSAVSAALAGRKVGWFAPSYKLILPTYKRINSMIKPMVEHSSKVDSLIETHTGGEIEFWTLENEDAGRSRSYDLVIVDEGSLKKKGLKAIWQQSIEPTLLDRRGSAIMAGTPKGIDPDNFFYEVCTDKRAMADGGLGWHEIHMPTRMNPTLDAQGVENLINEYPPLVYQQEFLAEFVDWSGAAFFERDKMLINGQPVSFPVRCDAVFATIDTAVKAGKEHDGTAVCYWALDKVALQMNQHPLTLLDWDITQMEGAVLETWLPSVFIRLEEMSAMCGARRGNIGAWIEDKATGMVLLQQARNRGWLAHAIDSDLTAMGKDERAISVSGYVYRGWCKMSDVAFNKIVTYKQQARNHFMSQVFGYRVGQKDAPDDLCDTFTYGLAIALGDAGGY